MAFLMKIDYRVKKQGDLIFVYKKLDFKDAFAEYKSKDCWKVYFNHQEMKLILQKLN